MRRKHRAQVTCGQQGNRKLYIIWTGAVGRQKKKQQLWDKYNSWTRTTVWRSRIEPERGSRRTHSRSRRIRGSVRARQL